MGVRSRAGSEGDGEGIERIRFPHTSAPGLRGRQGRILEWKAMFLILLLPAVAPADDDLVFFESKIRPLLAAHCYECHSARSSELKGGLRLDSRAGVVQGGDSGALIMLGDPAKSLLIKAVSYRDSDLQICLLYTSDAADE